ncbi:MAG: urease accessory protein UreE [Gammaproteobacteria bacterium]|nr:urease accessory protein UreE [Gammaproteobacteria bacterium]
MIEINSILGHTHDSKLSDQLHDLAHNNQVEYISLDHANLQRRRFRAKTNKGTDCAITISRDEKLSNGAVLVLDENRAIVVKMVDDQWLSLRPKDLSAAIELGYFAGNMHWRVKFDNQHLNVALDNPEEIYLERLKEFFDNNKITRINHD